LAFSAQIALAGSKAAPSGVLGLLLTVALVGLKGAPSGDVEATISRATVQTSGARPRRLSVPALLPPGVRPLLLRLVPTRITIRGNRPDLLLVLSVLEVDARIEIGGSQPRGTLLVPLRARTHARVQGTDPRLVIATPLVPPRRSELEEAILLGLPAIFLDDSDEALERELLGV
jgi:hypothetical protein